ncbi:hypothetical protein BV22DRAFT_1035533 [Leucogyrophana mollusca]|uniref:Uncharacterized protein n=1 Tax=Leucogyrophana mollusca TaxID=85980 RepID=A0ACB8BFP1_9AGAM|nr:hypothetical protein BV22DRAFT_1035533 [Leucogyrophana mollusca]
MASFRSKDRLEALTKLSAISTGLFQRVSPRSRSVQIVVKYLCFLVLLANFRSLPFAWHIRVFFPIGAVKIRYYLLYLRLFFTPKATRTKVLDDWVESLCPVGMNPFEMVTVHKSWAGLDDSDCYGHLSNSSYAKILDSARLKTALNAFPAFGRSGGWVGLASTHYHFIREIPIFASYEIRMTFGAWDHKWMYVISRFVSSNKKSVASKASQSTPGSNRNHGAPTISLNTSTKGHSTPVTPSNVFEADCHSQADKTAKAMKALAIAQSRGDEPDGATLYCVAISYVCFKHGRISVPPAIVLACEGFSKPPSADSNVASFSPAHPPPHWAQAQGLRVAPAGNMKKYIHFLRGGWRDVPEGERWFEEALGGVVEERRKANFEILESVKNGMEGARTIR